MTKYYPINLDLKKKLCVVVGGGKVAERKVKRLLKCDASVKVISPEFTSGLKVLAKKGRIIIEKKCVSMSDLKNAYLVISAADDRKVNSFVYAQCLKKNILVNVVDSPGECNFILPSIVSKGDLTISISTGGVSPALSKNIRKDLEKEYGPEYAVFLRIMKKLRPKVMEKVKDSKKRRAFFEKATKPEIFNLLRIGGGKRVKQELEGVLRDD